ncbi:MAG: Fe-S protein assembly co-chaperone HscB [Deltaproteobacteria bacterium]|nr:Fe-S protein assembly co-chaperone HscB [Deltaproteobacteria bacterium]
MAKCWSCGAERRDAFFCGSCEKIQPIAATTTHFDLLDIPPRFAVPSEVLDRAFRTKSKRVHPDRYGAHSSIERRLALDHTARINEAYRALKTPASRAEYLLTLEGVDIGREDARTQNPGLLMALLETQEAIEVMHDRQALLDEKSRIEARRDSLLAGVGRYFDEGVGTRQDVVDALTELRYLSRILETISRRLED